MKSKLLTGKHPRHSRLRQPHAFQEIWTNARAAHIGYGHGCRYSSVLIAEQLGDGTDDATIRKMIREWGLPSFSRGIELSIPLSRMQRSYIEARARQNSLSPTEYCRRMLIRASMPHDLYSAIVTDPEAFE